MTYKTICCLILILLIPVFGCGLKEGVVQKDSKSFFWFTGDTGNTTVYIDDLSPFTLSDTGKKEVHYEIEPGKHSVIVKKSGIDVVNRNVLLGNGVTMEIKIP